MGSWLFVLTHALSASSHAHHVSAPLLARSVACPCTRYSLRAPCPPPSLRSVALRGVGYAPWPCDEAWASACHVSMPTPGLSPDTGHVFTGPNCFTNMSTCAATPCF